MDSTYKKTILAISVLIIALGLLSLFYFRIESKKIVNVPVDYYAMVVSSNLYSEGESLRTEKKYSDAILAFHKGLDSATSTGEKSIFDTAIATTIILTDPTEGIKQLVRIGNDVSYPNVSRAFALQYAYEVYLGYKKPGMLRPFLTEEELSTIDPTKPLSDEVVKSIHQRIYALAPLPITKARLAQLSWKMSGRKDIESVNGFMDDFLASIQDTENYEGMSSLLPPAYSLAAYLSADMKRTGVLANFGTPESLYEQAISRAQNSKIESAYQFGLLNYATYLMSQKQPEKSAQLLTLLAARPIYPTVSTSVKSKALTQNYLPLTQAAQTDQKMKTLLTKIGFLIK